MADPTIKIKIDYKDIPKGTKVIISELKSLDDKAEDTAAKYLQLSYTLKSVGQKLIETAGHFSKAATDVGASNKRIRRTLNTTKQYLADFNNHSMLRVNFDVEDGKDDMATFSKNINTTKNNIKKFNDYTSVSDERLENMATAMDKVNKQTLTLKNRSNKASKDMRGLNNAVFELTKGLQDQISKLNEAGRKINKNVASFDKLEKAMNSNTKAVKKHGEAYKKVNKTMGDTASTGINLRNIFAGLITLQSINLVIQYADAWEKLTNNIRIFAGSEAELITIRNKLFEISQKTRTELTAQVTLYNRLKIAQKDLGISESGILKVTESVGYALGVTSTSALEARGSLIQLGQALGSGIVRAEEFNSINEGTPKIIQAVAEAFNMSRSQLRTLVLDGKILSSDFSNALIVMSDSLKKEYGTVNQTIEQSFINIRSQVQRLAGEIGKSTGIYKGFTDILKGFNKYMDENSDAIIRNSGIVLDLIGALIGAGGLMLAFKLMSAGVNALTTSFKTLSLAMKANLVILAIMTAYDVYKIGSDIYSKRWGSDAEALKEANNKLETEISRKGKLLDNISGEGVLDALRSTDVDTAIRRFKSQIDDLEGQINTIETGAKTPGRGGESFKYQLKDLQKLKVERERINKALATALQLKNAIQSYDDQAAVTAKQEVEARTKQLNQNKIDAAKRKVEQDFLKAHNKEIKELTGKYNLIQKAKKKILSFDKYTSRYNKENLAMYNSLVALVSEEETTTERLNTLRKGAGKLPIDANKAEITSLDILNRKNKELDDIEKKLKSGFQQEVSNAEIAQKHIDALKRGTYANEEAVKSLISYFKVFVDKGDIAKTNAEKLGIALKEGDPAFLALLSNAKDLNVELEAIETAQKSINKLKTKVQAKEAVKTQLDSFFTTSGMAIDSEGEALYNRINDSILELKTSMQGLKEEYKDKVDISMEHVLSLVKEKELYLEKKKYEKEITDYVTDQGRTRYQVDVDNLRKTAALMQEKYPELVSQIASYTEASIQAMHPMEAYINSLEEPIIAIENVFVNAFQGMEDSLVNFVKTGKFEWKSFVASIIEGMIKIEAQKITTSALSSMSGLFSGIFGASSYTSSLGLHTTGHASGGIFGSNGMYASGGAFTNSIVSKPTMFAHGGGFGVMGEAGDEAILPLSRTSSGNLGVEASVSQPNVILNVENKTGQNISANQISSEMVGKDLVLSIVMEAANNNGAFQRTLKGSLSR